MKNSNNILVKIKIESPIVNNSFNVKFNICMDILLNSNVYEINEDCAITKYNPPDPPEADVVIPKDLR